MKNEFEAIDGLVEDIVGTANLISRIFFNKNSVLIVAAITLVLGVLFISS